MTRIKSPLNKNKELYCFTTNAFRRYTNPITTYINELMNMDISQEKLKIQCKILAAIIPPTISKKEYPIHLRKNKIIFFFLRYKKEQLLANCKGKSGGFPDNNNGSNS